MRTNGSAKAEPRTARRETSAPMLIGFMFVSSRCRLSASDLAAAVLLRGSERTSDVPEGQLIFLARQFSQATRSMHLPLRAIAVFHAAARVGSISRAAQELGVTPSAVSQQIASLELH